MGDFKCKVCDDKIACRAVDEELEKGMSGAAVARLMTLRGFSVTDKTILSHNQHRRPIPMPGVTKNKRDAAIMIRDKVLDAIERMDDDDLGEDRLGLGILNKELQPALNTALKAEAILDKREARTDDKKLTFQLAVLLAGGPAGLLAPPDLIDTDANDEVIEGEAVEVE